MGAKSFAELRLALEIMFEGVEGAGMLPVAGVDEVSEGARGGRGQMIRSWPNSPLLISTTPLPPDQAGSASFSTAVGAASSVCVGELVTVSYREAGSAGGGTGGGAGSEAHVLVEWEGGRVGDTVADAVVAVLLQVWNLVWGEGGGGSSITCAVT